MRTNEAPISRPIRGKPKNPYLGSNPIWQPGGTAHLIDQRADLVRGRDLEQIALTLLERIGVPVLRRVLEPMLVFDHSFSPQEVTDSLSALRQRRKIQKLSSSFAHGDDLYYAGPSLSDTQEERYATFIAKLYAEREALLTKDLLKIAGERFVRSMLIHSGQFIAITTLADLGNVTLRNGSHALDLRATRPPITYGVSVKNQARWMFSGDRAIKDAYTKADAQGFKPWLIASFITQEAQDRCRARGIRVDSIGAQVLPAEYGQGKRTEVAIRSLRSVIGPQPFIYIPSRFRFSHYEQHSSRFTSICPKGRG